MKPYIVCLVVLSAFAALTYDSCTARIVAQEQTFSDLFIIGGN